MAEVLKIGREKGQKASKPVRDIEEMRKGVENYEKVLDSGKDKSLISKWSRKSRKRMLG